MEFTLKLNKVESAKLPSLTVTVIVALPCQFSDGVSVSNVLSISTATAFVSEVALNINSSSSTFITSNVSTNGASSLVIWILISASTGASFTGLTVRLNVAESVKLPSLTITEILAVPFQSSTGVMVNESPPTIETVTSAVSVDALKLSSFPSVSLADKVIVSGVSSSVS